MPQKFIFSDKAVHSKPVNPDFIMTFERHNTESRTNKYTIIFAVSDQGTKARDVIWYFEAEDDRDKAFENIRCMLCFPV